jgi:hypothetical protein
MDANSTHLTLVAQSPVIPNCSHLRYSVDASSNCGSCSESTKSPTIICTNFTTSVDADKICNLTVGGIICDSMPGEKASLLINLKGRSIIIMLLCMSCHDDENHGHASLEIYYLQFQMLHLLNLNLSIYKSVVQEF